MYYIKFYHVTSAVLHIAVCTKICVKFLSYTSFKKCFSFRVARVIINLVFL